MKQKKVDMGNIALGIALNHSTKDRANMTIYLVGEYHEISRQNSIVFCLVPGEAVEFDFTPTCEFDLTKYTKEELPEDAE